METKKRGNFTKVQSLMAAYAVSLRKEGKTYKEIVELCGEIDPDKSVSLDWCKRNLKDIEKQKLSPELVAEATCLEQIAKLAVLPKGISSAECKMIIKHNHRLKDAEEIFKLYKKYKAKTLASVPEAFFRPSCLQPNQAKQSFKKIISSGNYIYDIVADYVSDICQQYPEVYSHAVRRELASIVFPELKLMGGGALRCKHLERAVEALTERVVQQEECSVIPAKAITDFDDEYIPY